MPPDSAAASKAERRLRTASSVQPHSGLDFGHGVLPPHVGPAVEGCVFDRAGDGSDPTRDAIEGIDAVGDRGGGPGAGNAVRRPPVFVAVALVFVAVALGEVQVRGDAQDAFCGDERRK
jgi:hypothetical protein